MAGGAGGVGAGGRSCCALAIMGASKQHEMKAKMTAKNVSIRNINMVQLPGGAAGQIWMEFTQGALSAGPALDERARPRVNPPDRCQRLNSSESARLGPLRTFKSTQQHGNSSAA